MTDNVTRWREEHSRFAVLLAAVERQLDRFHEGERPDYSLVLEAMRYMNGYPDRCHHPREDIAFETIAAREPRHANAVANLVKEHSEIRLAGEELVGLLEDVLDDAILSRQKVETPGRAYIRLLHDHMRREEEFFGRTAALLNEERLGRHRACRPARARSARRGELGRRLHEPAQAVGAGLGERFPIGRGSSGAPLLGLLLPVLSPPDFGRELLQFRIHGAASRNDSDRLAPFDDRQVAESVFLHYDQAIAEWRVGIDCLGRAGHHLRKSRGLGIESPCHDSKYDIALGKYSNEAIVFNDHDCADILGRHELGGFADEGPWRGLENLSSLHDASGRSIEHPGTLSHAPMREVERNQSERP